MLNGTIRCLVFLCCAFMGVAASAQEKYPSKPIKYVVAFSAGGGQDLMGRALQPHLQRILGQSVVIVNRSGAGGAIGFNEVANATPDGYTIGQISPSLQLLKYTVKDTTTDWHNYDTIMFGGYSPYGILVRRESPWTTWKEFQDYARANPKKVRVGNPGHGGNGHIACIGMELAAKIEFIHVPYKGVAPSFQEVMGGHIDAICGGLSDSLALVKAGRLKFLALAAPERSKVVPDVPTFKELGMVADFSAYYGWVGPKGMPKDRIETFYKALRTSMESKEFRDFADSQGVTISIKDPREFAKSWADDDRKWRELTTIGGVKPQ